ncbi:MAG: hypothetical protein K2N82_13375, partial [Lachnospiraceae bacterium]|nr:hypothetical protein [Lachnospiraceae bacterium]
MIPIEKNILVVDEQGNEYEATWPKRARGLVKNGRARFLSENKICLACPPITDLEDNEMTDIEKNNIKVTENDVPKSESVEAIDLAYIFKQIKEIQTQTEYLNGVINTLSQMSDGDSGEGGSPGNIQGQAKAQALGDVVRCRETT